MNALIRQLAVLSVLWATLEMLLPDGRQQRMVRAAVSALVMAALLSAAGGWMRGDNAVIPTAAQAGLQITGVQYQRTALTAFANQAKRWCERFCEKAGYECEAGVYLRLDGAAERVEVMLRPVCPLLTPGELRTQLAHQLQIEAEQIVIVEDS